MSQRAWLLIDGKRYADALSEARRGLAEDPEDVSCLTAAAFALARLERHEEARSTAEAGVAAAPDDPWTHFTRARVLAIDDELDDALAAVDAALEIDPEAIYALEFKAALLNDHDDLAGCIELIESVLRLDPDRTWARSIRATALMSMNRLDEARFEFDALLALEPEDAGHHENRGWVALRSGDAGDALPYFQEAMRLDPNRPDALYGLYEALKARHPLYRPYLRYELFMARRSWLVRVGVRLLVIALFIGAFFLIPEDGPDWLFVAIHASFLVAVLAIYLGFAGYPAFNALLLADSAARHSMKGYERAAGVLFSLSLGLAVVFFSANFVLGERALAWFTLLAGLTLASPLWGALTMEKRWTTWLAALSAALVATLFLTGGVLTLVPEQETQNIGGVLAGLTMLVALKNRWLLFFLRLMDVAGAR